MAETIFDDLTLLTSDQLVKYLEDQGIVGDDLAKIQQGGYNGKTILHLADDNNERLYRLKLSDSSTAVLEDILEKYGVKTDKDSSDVVLKRNQPTLRSKTSEDLFTSFGLGYGVCALEINALQNSHGKVRAILPDLSNVEERPQNRRDFYEQEISSIESFHESAHASVSDSVGKMLSISAEAEYSRMSTEKLLAKGEKMTTRVISFKPFHSREYHHSGDCLSDATLEEDLAKWIIDSIPDIQSACGSTAADKLERYLQEYPEHFELAVDAAYLFLISENLTHYIQAIDLGAATYSLSIIKESSSSGKTGLAMGTQQVGDVGSTTEAKKERYRKFKNDQSIGSINTVSRNNGEQVVGAKLAPVFTLVTKKVIKNVLQKATVLFLHRASGPFIISCGERNDKYLRVNEAEHKREVLGVDDEEKASIFYIQTRKHSKVFNIVHYGDKEDDRFTKAAFYLQANPTLGQSDGPLEIGGATATNFILRHPSKEGQKLSIEVWERDGCFVQIAPRKFHIASYVGFDESHLKTVCVRSMKDEGSDNIWLRFQLHRTRKESCEHTLPYGSSQGRQQEVITGESSAQSGVDLLKDNMT